MAHSIKRLKRYTYQVVRPLFNLLRAGNVAMFHLGRSGSSVLGSLLQKHTNVFWDGELYYPIFRQWRDEHDGQEIVGELTENPYKLLHKNMSKAGARWYGAEFKPFHLHFMNVPLEQFVEHLQTRKFSHFIILERKNRLRVITSALVASQDGVYKKRDKKHSALKQVLVDPNDIRIDFDVKPLLHYLEDYDQQLSRLADLLRDQNVLRLVYEDDIESDPTAAYRKVCNFLEVPYQPVNVELRRINPFPIQKIIANFSVVEAVLKGTPYEWMLYE